MSKRVTKKEYVSRRLANIKKARHRKKFIKHPDKRFMNYCIRKMGVIQGVFYAIYSDDIAALVYNENPFL